MKARDPSVNRVSVRIHFFSQSPCLPFNAPCSSMCTHKQERPGLPKRVFFPTNVKGTQTHVDKLSSQYSHIEAFIEYAKDTTKVQNFPPKKPS